MASAGDNHCRDRGNSFVRFPQHTPARPEVARWVYETYLMGKLTYPEVLLDLSGSPRAFRGPAAAKSLLAGLIRRWIVRVQEMKACLGNIVRSCLRKKKLVAGEMVRWLKKSRGCFPRGPELGSQPHTGQLTTTHNSSPRQFNTLFWPPWSAAGMLKGKIITIKPQLLNNNIKSINNAS